MPTPARILLTAAAILGLLGVALGAFGAHAFDDILDVGDRRAWWQTATLYHLTHAPVALIAAMLSAHLRPRLALAAGWCFLVGIVIFSGSLYLLATSAAWAGSELRWLGAITPLGGVSLILGWLLLAASPLMRHKR